MTLVSGDKIVKLDSDGKITTDEAHRKFEVVGAIFVGKKDYDLEVTLKVIE